MTDSVRVPPAVLKTFVAGVLTGHGLKPDHAAVCATRLVEADLRGRRGHGVSRVPAYCERIRSGGMNPTPDIRVLRETPVSALVDGDNGLGPVIATVATEAAIDKARTSGLSWVGIRRSNHAGAAGVYTNLLTEADLIGVFLAVANTNQLPPWGGSDPLLGTNPVSIGIPAGEEPAVNVDIATTVVSFGEIKMAEREGRELPRGWMIDRTGQPLTDPQRAGEGFLLPIGGHKGYGLSLAIGLLAGVMNGARFGADVVDHYQDLVTPTDTGQAIMAVRPDLFRDLDEFKAEVDAHVRALRASTRLDADEPIRIPGEQAAAQAQDMSRRGVPLPAALVDELRTLADEVGATPLDAP